MKLIFGDGDRESEIFLHINASIKKGQFSMKDPRFGDLALAELAKVLRKTCPVRHITEPATRSRATAQWMLRKARRQTPERSQIARRLRKAVDYWRDPSMKLLPVILLAALSLSAQNPPAAPPKKGSPNTPPPEAGDDVRGYNDTDRK